MKKVFHVTLWRDGLHVTDQFLMLSERNCIFDMLKDGYTVKVVRTEIPIEKYKLIFNK